MRNPSSLRGARAVTLGVLVAAMHATHAAELNEGGIQLEHPSLQSEQIDSEKMESDSGGVSGKDVAPDTRPDTKTQPQVPLQREEPSGAQQKAPAALQEGTSGSKPGGAGAELRERLPETQRKDLELKSIAPDITGVTPRRGEPGTRVRLRGRNFGARAGDRAVFVWTERDDLWRMDVRVWTDDEIVAVIPSGAPSGRGSISIGDADGRLLASVPFELLEGTRTLGSGGADLSDKRPPGGFTSETPSIDKAELTIVEGPTWRWDGGSRSAGSVLYYGHRYEVSFEVKNLGDQPARYRPKYEIGNQLRGFPERTIEPGETQRITWDVPFGVSPLGFDNRRRVMEDERIDTEVYLAEAELGAGVYGDSEVSNNISRRSWDVRRELRLVVDLQRLKQYAECAGFTRERDWELRTRFVGAEEKRAHVARLDGNPAFLDASVRATMSLGPLRYRSPVEPDASEVGFGVSMYAVKDDGSIKNSGRSVRFSMTEPLRGLMGGRVSREISSTEPGGRFCGDGNLGLDAAMWLQIAPYE